MPKVKDYKIWMWLVLIVIIILIIRSQTTTVDYSLIKTNLFNPEKNYCWNQVHVLLEEQEIYDFKITEWQGGKCCYRLSAGGEGCI